MNKVLDFVKKHQLIHKGDRVILGVSGGADSVYLLLCFCALKVKMELDLHVIHINHQLRKEAKMEEDFVKDLCQRLEVKVDCISVDVEYLAKAKKISLEEAGREARYDAFYNAMDTYDANKIAVAHHQNDQAETFLFRVARGTGISGAGGMKPGSLPIIRPLLCMTKNEIIKELKKLNQPWMEDSSNEDVAYARNQVRHEVIPELERINDKTVEHISNLCEDIQEASMFLEEQLSMAYECLVRQENEQLIIAVKELLNQPRWIRNHLVKRMLETKAGKKKDIEKRHVIDILSLAEGPTGKTINLPYEVMARKSYDDLILFRAFEEEELPKGILNTEIVEKISNIGENDCIKIIDYDRIEKGVKLRYRQPGDVIVIDDQGSMKTLKKYFIDEKVPRHLRNQVPLVADGNQIIWIVGYRLNHKYKVTDETKRYLRLEFKRKAGDFTHGD